MKIEDDERELFTDRNAFEWEKNGKQHVNKNKRAQQASATDTRRAPSDLRTNAKVSKPSIALSSERWNTTQKIRPRRIIEVARATIPKPNFSLITYKIRRFFSKATSKLIATIPRPILSQTTKQRIKNRLIRTLLPVLNPKATSMSLLEALSPRPDETGRTPITPHVIDALSFVGLLAGIGALFAAAARSVDFELQFALIYGLISAIWLTYRTKPVWEARLAQKLLDWMTEPQSASHKAGATREEKKKKSTLKKPIATDAKIILKKTDPNRIKGSAAKTNSQPTKAPEDIKTSAKPAFLAPKPAQPKQESVSEKTVKAEKTATTTSKKPALKKPAPETDAASTISKPQTTKTSLFRKESTKEKKSEATTKAASEKIQTTKPPKPSDRNGILASIFKSFSFKSAEAKPTPLKTQPKPKTAKPARPTLAERLESLKTDDDSNLAQH